MTWTPGTSGPSRVSLDLVPEGEEGREEDCRSIRGSALSFNPKQWAVYGTRGTRGRLRRGTKIADHKKKREE